MINYKVLPQAVNGDDDAKYLSDKEVLNIENMQLSVAADGENYQLKNIPSTISLYNDITWTSPKAVGRTVDLARKRLIWLHYDAAAGNHTIYAYDTVTQATYTVLKSSQTAEGLHFSTSFRADRNVRVVGDLLFWTNNQSEPQCINIEAGIKLNHSSYSTTTQPYATNIPYTTLTLIKRPPVYRLGATKVTDGSFDGNFIDLTSFQFLYRYQYKNDNYSVLSTYSQLLPANSKGQTFNAIDLKMPFGETIDDYVQQVDICVRYGNTGKSYIIKSYNKKDATDAAAIIAHNSSITQLGFRFYNNISGTPLDDTTANTSFDAVALAAKTLEVAKNRLLLANLLKGYTTPSATSLTCTLGTFDTGGAGTYTAAWHYFKLYFQDNISGVTSYTEYYYAYNATIGAYYYDAYKFSVTPPPSLNSTDATTVWATETQLAAYIQRNTAPPSGSHWVFGAYTFTDTGDTLDIIFAVDLGGLQFFKSSSAYQVSIAFYDRYRRKCGVTKPQEVRINDRTFDQSVFAANIAWAVSNTNALTEIPDWAYYYQIHITKSETYASFIQIYAGGSDYVLKNQDGTYSYTHTTFSANTTYATAIDITSLNNKGIGYVFDAANGDLCRIYKSDGTNQVLRVIGQDGNFVLLSPEDIGTTGASTGFLIELYTPNKTALSAVYFETGDMMDILLPATSSRTYSALNGTINGDCYAIERDKGSSGTELYFCEAMNPNDKIWYDWETDRGWTNIIDSIGQQRKETSIDWSDTFINGTRDNNLNKFGALNTKDIGNTSGSIQKLQLTNKQQEDGTVLLILAEQTPFSAYLSERQLVASATNDSLVQTDEVIGSINELKNGFGTINPESVVEYNGEVWWFDAIHGVICQYSDNGAFPVSDFKMHRFFDRYAKKYTTNGYDTYTHPVHASYDTSTDELLIALPQVQDAGFVADLPSYGGIVPDYTDSIKNRFDIYNGQAQTVIYKPLKNSWAGSYGWLAEGMEYVGNRVFAWKNGVLFVHNEDFTSFNTIYNVQYPQRICIAANAGAPSAVKQVMDIALEVNGAVPNYTVLYSNYPIEQISDLVAADWENKEGVLYASFRMDRLSFSDAIAGLLEGDIITSQNPLISLEFNEFSNHLILNNINIGVLLSKGQNAILPK